MSVFAGPEMVNSGLIFGFDMSNTNRSWKGPPTINLHPNATLTGMQNVTFTYVGLEDGWSKYALSGTYTGGTYSYIVAMSGISFSGNTTYSTGVFVKSTISSKLNTNFTGMNYVNEPMNLVGTSFSIAQPDGSIFVGRYGFQYINTTPQFGYFLSQPIANNTVFYSNSDFVWIKNSQIEQNPFNTTYTSGARSNANCIIDITGSSVITAPSLSYVSNNTFSFNGTIDYIDSGPIVGSGNSSQSITWSCWVRPATASGDIINMRYTPTGWNMCPIWASGQVFYAKVWNNPNMASSSFTLNQYYYLALVRDASSNTNTFYVNGNMVANQVGAYSSSGYDNTLYFGRAGAQATNTFFTGQIPMAHVYNRALSASEIRQNFNALRGKFNI